MNLIRGVTIYLREVLSGWGLTVARTCSTAIFVWPIMPGQVFLIWRQFSEVDFNLEADSGGSYNMEADFEGRFQCGGGFRGQIYLWRWILEALGVY
jgi:hypothetical protein